MSYTPEQKKVITKIVRVGKSMGAGRKTILAAIETGLVESHLTNIKGGDGSSTGWRQETAESYPNVNRNNVGAAAKRFYTEARGGDKSGSAGQLAQSVQRSAFPGRYDQQKGQAVDILNAFNRGKIGKVSGQRVRPKDGGNPRRDPVAAVNAGPDPAALSMLRKDLLLGGDLSLRKLLDYKSQVGQVPDRITPGQPAVPDGGRPEPNRPHDRGRQGPWPKDKLANTGHGLREMFRIASAQDKKKLPYVLGGGHGATPAKVGTPVDCSGYVSMILGVSPRVSGNFQSSWGKPGGGKHVTVYANPEHVLIKMKDPRSKKWRWFATSRSNPSGGAGEISPPDAGYLSGFTKRHPGKR